MVFQLGEINLNKLTCGFFIGFTKHYIFHKGVMNIDLLSSCQDRAPSYRVAQQINLQGVMSVTLCTCR